MASIGKFIASLTSVSNEVTLAVAQFNMDFTLMKVEAPHEYQGLGSALSPNRREQAEAGLPHTTARKLGALFESIIPDTPKLYAAYGQRASEIGNSDPTRVTNSRNGPFSAHEGLDGTSLWAAATSGKHAIAMHLLGCILSKIWKGPEAISVWVELVTRRKAEIMAGFDESSMQSSANLMAARQDITRASLAAWDASARAWLQTADEVNQSRQIQLRLVLDNITIPVNSHQDLYQSVLKAWTDALVMVESLVAGMPQSINDGGVLLALSAWHLYPDMLVLGSTTAHIEQKDPLVGKGGILTMGLRHKDDGGMGVFWSLPLAHMRYYGEAPVVSRSLATDSSRISFEQLYQVTLGCLTAQWNMPLSDIVKLLGTIRSTLSNRRKPLQSNTGDPEAVIGDTGESSDLRDGNGHLRRGEDVNIGRGRGGTRRYKPHRNYVRGRPAKVVPKIPHSGFAPMSIAVGHRIEGTFPVGDDGINPSVSLSDGHWFSVISEAAIISQNATGQNKEHFTKLSKFGARRGTSFLNSDSERSPQPSFGLCGLKVLLQLCHGPEARVQLLRSISMSFQVSPNDIFIRYQISERNDSTFAYASALPHRFETSKRSVEGNQREVESHIRWTYHHPRWFADSGSKPTDLVRSEYLSHIEQLRLSREKCYFVQAESIRESDEFILAWTDHGLERYTTDETGVFDETDPGYIYPGAYDDDGKDDDVAEFEYITGDIQVAAIFIRRGPGANRYSSLGKGIDVKIDELVGALSGKMVDPNKLDAYMHTWGLESQGIQGPSTNNISISLRSLATVSSFYQDLSYATVNMAVVSQPLHKAKWIQGAARSDGIYIELDLPRKFSCIAMFESGLFNIDPEHLDRVMALAVGNSIYVADILQHEPFHGTDRRSLLGITKIHGSLGRSEMAMLVSPGAPPSLKALDCKDWSVVNHDVFNGDCHDCFQNTTLHLSFTDFDMPVDVGTRGIRDTEVILVESIVSMHDRGNWVGDLEIVSALSQILAWRNPPTCSHSKESMSYKHASVSGSHLKLVAIDNWDELLDMPSENVIIRAHGNWPARLAAAAISVQKNRRTAFLPLNACWECLSKDESVLRKGSADLVSLIC